MFNQVFQGLPC